MRIHISHSTTYAYDLPAGSIIQVLRLEPSNHDGQYVADWRIDLSVDARLRRNNDAFGNITHVFTCDGPLDHLTISVEGQIDTHDTSGFLRGTSERFPPSLFLRSTDLSAENEAMRQFTTNLIEKTGDEPLLFLHSLLKDLNARMAFDSTPTHSGTTATEAFTLGRGVCQDYAHIFIGCARMAGVPARYISGHFLRADGNVHQDAGHAWAEAFVPDLGWIGFDPANGICTTDAHVRVAMGLDYLGAAPVRGSRVGGGLESLSVAVKVDQMGQQSQG